MHGFKIIHLDIKPENIIFSSHFAKPVFIDFGFSEIINEKIGVKSLTEFKGTLNFCTREMFALMGEK
jgi:serine/threonine protein kinase